MPIRPLTRAELARVGEIDRTEHIDVLYEQRGTELLAKPGSYDAPAWYPTGDGPHSIAAQQWAVAAYVDRGGIALGAFADERLVGIAIVVPHVRPTIAQLAFLHVSHGSRGSGIGRDLVAELERIAHAAGDTEMVVSATPSANTIGFYRGRGFAVDPVPLPELLAEEPDDVHLRKRLKPLSPGRPHPAG